MKIALATCAELPGWEVDDQPLIESLQSKGATVAFPIWNDAHVDWEQFDITVIRTTWDYHLKKNEFVAWCNSVPRLFNNAAIVSWNTHKSYLRELSKKGVAIAPTVWIDTGEKIDAARTMEQFKTDRGFIKPQVGACASDTLRFTLDNVKEAQAFLDSQLHQDMMMQPYIASVETDGELSAIFIDGTLSHGVQKIPVAGDYRVQDDFGASDMPYTFTRSEVREMNKTLLAVPDNASLLYARFDYLRSDEGTLLLNELELVEPSLFFRHSEESASLLADAIIKRYMMQS
jgi:hypothetical protein